MAVATHCLGERSLEGDIVDLRNRGATTHGISGDCLVVHCQSGHPLALALKRNYWYVVLVNSNPYFRAFRCIGVAIVLLGGCKTDTVRDNKTPQTSTATPAPTAQQRGTGIDAGQTAGHISAESAVQIKKPLLWSISKDNVIVGHLLGSIHMGVDAKKRFPKFVWDILGSAKHVCSEADASDLSIMDKMVRSDGSTLEKQLGPVLWRKFSDIIGDFMANGMKQMKPAVAASALLYKALPQTPSMDATIIQEAKKSGTSVSYLEELGFQIDLLDKHFDTNMLKEMIERFDDMKSESRAMIAAYVTGDVKQLQSMVHNATVWGMGNDNTKFKSMLEELLYVRNHNWIPKLEKLFERGKTFCVVGQAHLPGDRGVLDLLSKKGYIAKRIAN